MFFILFPAFVQAREGARDANRWTLAEWLEQKDRNRMMDMWLSMNSSSPFEFMMSLSHLGTDYETAANQLSTTSLAGEIHAYAQFVGLTLEHEHDSKAQLSDLSGLFNLRLFGDSMQNSYLALHGGQLTRKHIGTSGNAEYRHLVSQASLQIYFTKYFGLNGSYRWVLPTKDQSKSFEAKGHITQAGLFIDFKNVRLFGALYDESMKYKDLSSEAQSESSRKGLETGFQIFY